MTDRTSGPGGDRHRTERLSRGDEWTPEQESVDRDEWAPGDAAPGHRVPRKPRPEERLPGEPAAGDARARRPGAVGPGREGLTADDRTPEDTPQPPPGPAGVTASPTAGRAEPVPGRQHGSEGLRPGTEDLGPETPGAEDRRPRSTGAAGRQAPAEEWEEEGQMPDNGLGAPAVGGVSWREARTTEGRAPDAWPTAPGSPAAPGTVGETTTAPSGTGAPLLPHEETDRWERRLREVTAGFVEQPREAVEQADRTVEEIARRFTEAVTRRRRTLRMSWEGTEERGPAAEADTEQLRLALRDYRELAGRLLHG